MQATKQQSYAALPNYASRPQRQQTKRTAARPHQRIVSRWDRVSIVGIIVACAMVFWGLAAANAHLTELNRSIDNLTTQSNKIAALNSSLTTQINSMSDPENALKAAVKDGEQYSGGTIVIPSGN